MGYPIAEAKLNSKISTIEPSLNSHGGLLMKTK